MSYEPSTGPYGTRGDADVKMPPIERPKESQDFTIDLSQRQISENFPETKPSLSTFTAPKQNWKQETPYGPTVINSELTFFNYPTVNAAITKLEVITQDANGKKTYHELTRKGDGFEGVLQIPENALYRLRFTYSDGHSDEVVDPAAPFLPNGVHDHRDERAWGQIWNQAAYEFQYKKPEGDLPTRPICSVFHVGIATKEGTFQAAKAMLPKLKEQGIDVIQLMPVGAVVGESNWGYDGVSNLYAPSQNYGTPDDMKSFIDEAHRLGLRVVLDVVYNHLSYDVVSQEYLLGNEIIDNDVKATDWGKKLNFKNPALQDFVLRNIDYWARDFNLDGFRIDAAWAIHEDAIKGICDHARKYNPNAMIAYEGCTRFCKELKKVIELGYYENKNNFVYDTGLLWVSTVAAFLPPEERHGFYKEIGIDYKNGGTKVDWAHTAGDLSKIEWNSLIGLCHDFYGNEAPHQRILARFGEIFGDTDGYMATKALFSIIMATPGAKMVFCGDESGAMTSPFAFFKQGLSPEKERDKARDRVHEWPDFFIRNASDKDVILGNGRNNKGWDGSEEQLRQLFESHRISEDSYKRINSFLPHRAELFENAKLSSSDLNCPVSKAWQRAFKEIVAINSKLRPAKKLNVTAHGDSMLLFEGLTDEDGNDICMAVNMTDTSTRLHLDWSKLRYDVATPEGVYQHNCEIIHTTADDEFEFKQDGMDVVQTATPVKRPTMSESYNEKNELEHFLNLPPHGVAYLKRVISKAEYN